MRIKYLLLVIALSISSVVSAKDWQNVVTESGLTMSSFYFINSSTGWIVSDDGYVGKTTDGGATITDLNSGIVEDLEKAYFIDADTGFVGGVDTAIYKTTDGGNTWSAISLPDEIVTGTDTVITGETIYGLYFANSKKGWILSSSSSMGQLLYTEDGGESWAIAVDSTSGDMEAMNFYDENSGVIVGGGTGGIFIYYTTDGTTWNEVTGDALPSFPSTVYYTRTDIRGVYMASKDTVYAVGWGYTGQPSMHLKSVDGGATWSYEEQSDDNATYGNLYGVYFKDTENGIAVGGSSSSGSIVVKTTDGGENWVPADIPCGATLYEVYGFGDDIILMSNSGEVMFSSSDFGDSWNLLTKPTGNLYAISAPTDDAIFAAGYNGLFYKSTDGGSTWDAGYLHANGVSSYIQDIFFVDQNVGYAAHSYGMVTKTTDGGETWTAVMPDTTATTITQYGLYFSSADTGFVVGRNGSNISAIYKTTDGGATWDTTIATVGAALNAVSFGSSQNGAAVGDNMNIVYTTDGGTTWAAASVPDSITSTIDFNDVAFTSAGNAIAIADDGIILKTTDGGATWNTVNVDGIEDFDLNGIDYKDNELWLAGFYSSDKDALIMQSTDGGTTWTEESIDYSVIDSASTLTDIAISPSGSIYISAYNTNIYAATTVSGVNDETDALSNNFSLSQNYPNPFNPTTNIKFSIPDAGNVTLKVYNILGQEVKTLVNKEMAAGSYEINFDASNLASGVYIYSIKAGSFNACKKMMLLK